MNESYHTHASEACHATHIKASRCWYHAHVSLRINGAKSLPFLRSILTRLALTLFKSQHIQKRRLHSLTHAFSLALARVRSAWVAGVHAKNDPACLGRR
jgi:hypothetical protein